MDKAVLDAIQTKETTLDKEISSGKVKISGDVNKFKEYLGLFDTFSADFNIVTP